MIDFFLDHASSVQVSLLLQEGMTMYGLSHKNILSVFGVSIEDHTAPFLIYPNQGFKNLKRFDVYQYIFIILFALKRTVLSSLEK